MLIASNTCYFVLQTRPCEPGRPLKCNSTGQCLIDYLACNGYDDCTDGSDEDVHFCKV